jgi:predicted nucleic acid-binding protein
MSGIKYLLDTNMIIGLLKGHDAAIALAEQIELVLEYAGISQISRMELLGYPKITEEEESAIRLFLQACQICLLDERIEAEATRLRRSGHFKLPDAIVAASAIVSHARLLTLDKNLIQGVQRLENNP